MRWTIAAAGILGIAAGAAAAMSVRTFRNGVFYSPYTLEEKIHFEDQTSGPYMNYRVVAHIPREYGRLVGVTDRGVLWFEDEQGVIRNAIVDDNRLLAIQRKGFMVVREP